MVGILGPREAPEPEASDVTMNPDGSASVELDDEVGPVVEELADGSAIVHEPEDEASATPEELEEFEANLAEFIDPVEASRIARFIIDAVDRDKEDREERDVQYAEGIKRTGISGEAPGGADFVGASKAVHPMLLEGCIDFAARTMKEIFPPSGPVKTHIIGKSTREKLDRAERKRKYMNWQCTRQIKELRPVVEQTLTQVPLGGSQYIKVWYDSRFARPKAEFVPIDKFFIPYAAASLDSASRKTHQQDITAEEFEGRIASGLYRDLHLSASSGSTPDKSEAEIASDKAEGRTDSSYNEDGLRTVYETYVNLDVDGDPLVTDDRLAPYIATVDYSTGNLLALYRNWDYEKDDDQYEELEWVVEAKFVVWRGAYGLGLIHLAGSLSAAATGSLRALLDSAHINNFPGALALKGARMAGQNVKSDPTEIAQIEGPTGVDDIRKLAMPFPFNGPSAVLFQLLEYVVQAGKNIINTAEETIADSNSNSPVGTTLAMIEQGSVTYSSIHARMHAMMARLLAILHRIDARYLDDEETVEELGDLVVSRADFQGPMDVVPVSDPNIFSETQRYAQLQAVLQLRSQFAPGSFKDAALLEQALRLLNYPGYEEILNTPLEAVERDAAEENFVASDPQAQLEVYDAQDHFAHLEAHVTFMASPILCANPMMAPASLPKLMEHCKQHLLEYYRDNVSAAVRALEAAPEFRADLTTPDKVIAEASSIVDKTMAEKLAPLMQVLQQVQGQMAQLIPPPADPALAVENAKGQTTQAVKKMEIDAANAREAQRVAAETQAEQARAASEERNRQLLEAANAQSEQNRLAAEAERAAQSEAAAAARHTEEMAIAARNAEIAEASERRKQDLDFVIAKMREEFETMRNNRDNQTAVLVEQLKTMLGAAEGAAGEKPTDAAVKPAAKDSTSEMLVEALVSLLRAQSEPRSYAIKRAADNSLELVSSPKSGQQPLGSDA